MYEEQLPSIVPASVMREWGGSERGLERVTGMGGRVRGQ